MLKASPLPYLSRIDCFGDRWIGLNDVQMEGKWNWSSGASCSYRSWVKPSGGSKHIIPRPIAQGGHWKDCAMVWGWLGGGHHKDSWQDQRCTVKLPYLCGGHGQVRHSAKRCLPGWSVVDVKGGSSTKLNGGCFKYFPDDLDFIKAEAYCVSHGAHLARIDSWQQNLKLREMAGATGRPLIGYTDIATERDWRWIDGAMSPFTAWLPGQPNNLGGQDCARMITAQDCKPVPKTYCHGRWDDIPCADSVHYEGFICRLDGYEFEHQNTQPSKPTPKPSLSTTKSKIATTLALSGLKAIDFDFTAREGFKVTVSGQVNACSGPGRPHSLCRPSDVSITHVVAIGRRLNNVLSVSFELTVSQTSKAISDLKAYVSSPAFTTDLKAVGGNLAQVSSAVILIPPVSKSPPGPVVTSAASDNPSTAVVFAMVMGGVVIIFAMVIYLYVKAGQISTSRPDRTGIRVHDRAIEMNLRQDAIGVQPSLVPGVLISEDHNPFPVVVGAPSFAPPPYFAPPPAEDLRRQYATNVGEAPLASEASSDETGKRDV